MFPIREEAKALLAEAADGTFTKSWKKSLIDHSFPNSHYYVE